MTAKVAVLVGSLRKDSINRKLAAALARLAAGKLELELVEIGDLPLYNDDLWASPPAAVTRFKQQMDAAGAVLFVTPEYNRTVPGLLVNACDWASRPWGKSSFTGKPAACIGASPGAIGTAMAQSHLRANMAGLGLVAMSRPEAFVQWKDAAHGPDGEVTDEETRKFLQSFVDALADHIARLG